MPQSLAAIYIHIVFSTRDRIPFLTESQTSTELHSYLGGIAKNLGCQPLGVGGVADHVHVLVRMSKTVALSDLIRDLKANSSSWVKQRVPSFAWQAGYGAFSFAADALAAEQKYVAEQEAHHAKVSFQDELRRLLRESGQEWDETYLWD
jgi:REP element-mobilizing transposase RayT